MAKYQAQRRAAALETPAPELFPKPDPALLLSTGCTVLNVAFSGHAHGGVPPSTYVHLVGDSGALKTWSAFSLFAEAARNPKYAKYRFVYDNAENGALMDVERYYGSGVLNRLEPPRKGQYGSTLVQEFYYHVELNVRRSPCIYVLDSMDALQDLADEDNFEAELKYYDTGKGKSDIKGSMGMNKSKTNSRNISRIANVTLRENGSILLVVSQTRDKVGSAIPGQKTCGGGFALKFYSHLQAWTKKRADLTNYYKGKEREIGVQIQADVQKNRISGWHGRVPLIDFLTGYGIDDVGTNINYLLDEHQVSKWKRAKPDPKVESRRTSRSLPDNQEEPDGKEFAAPEFDFTGTKDQLVKLVQEQGKEVLLAETVARVWREIVAGAAPERKARYS